jgi:F-type H+-transporting ATPase subunit epsilon
MYVEIITPDTIVFQGEAVSVKVPGSGGEFEALNAHSPIISSLNPGKVMVRLENEEKSFDISGGVVEVINNKVIILA